LETRMATFAAFSISSTPSRKTERKKRGNETMYVCPAEFMLFPAAAFRGPAPKGLFN